MRIDSQDLGQLLSGFGMGQHIQKLVSPLTGREEAAAATRACVFPPDERTKAISA